MISASELRDITENAIENDIFIGNAIDDMIVTIEAMAKTAASLGSYSVVIPLIGGIDCADYNELCDRLVARGYNYYLDSYCNLEVGWSIWTCRY